MRLRTILAACAVVFAVGSSLAAAESWSPTRANSFDTAASLVDLSNSLDALACDLRAAEEVALVRCSPAGDRQRARRVVYAKVNPVALEPGDVWRGPAERAPWDVARSPA